LFVAPLNRSARAEIKAGPAGVVMPPEAATDGSSNIGNSGRRMARKHSRNDPYGDLHREDEAPAIVELCWLCGRPVGKAIVWHHPVPKSRGGRDVVPMHPICQQTLITNFSNAELQRYGMDVEGLLANPTIRKFVDWVAKKDPDFTATTAKKQR
jgi:hypothetical protein